MPANVHRVAGTTMLGEIRPQADIAKGVVTALADGAASANDLMKHAAVSGMSAPAVLDTLLTLAAIGPAEPAMSAAGLAARKARTDRLNAVLWERSLARDEVNAAASPVTRRRSWIRPYRAIVPAGASSRRRRRRDDYQRRAQPEPRRDRRRL